MSLSKTDGLDLVGIVNILTCQMCWLHRRILLHFAFDIYLHFVKFVNSLALERLFDF